MIDKNKFEEIDDEKMKKSTGGVGEGIGVPYIWGDSGPDEFDIGPGSCISYRRDPLFYGMPQWLCDACIHRNRDGSCSIGKTLGPSRN